MKLNANFVNGEFEIFTSSSQMIARIAISQVRYDQ